MTFKRKPFGDWINLDYIQEFKVIELNHLWYVVYYYLNVTYIYYLDENESHESRENAQLALDKWMEE